MIISIDASMRATILVVCVRPAVNEVGGQAPLSEACEKGKERCKIVLAVCRLAICYRQLLLSSALSWY